MKVNTALILCAGHGKRLLPLTLNKPKPLLKLKNLTLLERTIILIKKLGVRKIIINTFYLKELIQFFIEKKNFDIDIKIIDDGKEILNTGGGILNMMNSSNETNFLTFNPDTVWSNDYIKHIQNMEKFYFSNKIRNILLLVNKNYSFDKKLKGDFNLLKNIIKKDTQNNLIYTGCQIINKDLFKSYSVSNFSISKIWNELVVKDELYGYESLVNFYHLTNLKVYEEILKNK